MERLDAVSREPGVNVVLLDISMLRIVGVFGVQRFRSSRTTSGVSSGASSNFPNFVSNFVRSTFDVECSMLDV